MADRPDGDALQKVGSVRADVVALLREKRYEETLGALYRARADSPGDPELQKGIDRIKEFLIGTYAKRLGGLDRVAVQIPLSQVRSPDAVLLARYIDGSSTYGDLAQICPLGQIRTLQVLVGLYCGSEPPRIYGMEPNRLTPEPPRSGVRGPEGQAEPAANDPGEPYREEDTRPPDTARSASLVAQARPIETEETRRYNELFARGTAAFVQGRYDDAADAFQACVDVRPGDRAAEVMLRRSLTRGEGR